MSKKKAQCSLWYNDELHMSDYLHYEAEDFLTDDYFIRWIKNPDNETDQFWNRFMMANPEKKQVIEIAAATLKAFQFSSTPLPDTFYTLLHQDITNTIAESNEVRKISFVRRLSTWLKVAAVFTGIAVCGSLLYWYLQPAEMITLATTYKQVKTFELPDHSLVTLNANSTLEYVKNWNNDQREVTLTGEGFFKITHIEQKSKAKKFTVHANVVNVEVLGTEFNVKNREHTTDVMLQSGKVQLQLKDEDSPHIMQPNDFISYNTNTKKLRKQTVNPTYYTAWLNHKYTFSKEKLSDVCRQLQHYYGLQFTIKSPQLANKEISGVLILDDESSMLLTLSVILNANIEQQGRKITIASK